MRVAPDLTMAGSLLTAVARTRVVLQRRRADTRASTEPRLASGTTPPPYGTAPPVSQTTSPFPRDFDPVNEGRDSVPYLDLQITAGTEPAAEGTGPPVVRAEGTGTAPRYVRTVARKGQARPAPRVDSITDRETDPIERVTNELDTSQVDRVVRELETGEVERVSRELLQVQHVVRDLETQVERKRRELETREVEQLVRDLETSRVERVTGKLETSRVERVTGELETSQVERVVRELETDELSAVASSEPRPRATAPRIEPNIATAASIGATPRDSDADIEPHLVARMITGGRETRELARIETDVAAGHIDTKVRSRGSADEIELSTQQVERVLETFDQPSPVLAQVPELRLSHQSWLGVVLSTPEVGAALVIGTWLRPEFCVTSPVMHVVPRAEGVLVQTLTNSRYFVKHGGDVYLVRRGHGPSL
ncbi:MAG TPA: hypothetical protein VIV11_13340 [Kofleriaceae bacterium]